MEIECELFHVIHKAGPLNSWKTLSKIIRFCLFCPLLPMYTHTHTHTQLNNSKLALKQNCELSMFSPKNQFKVKLCFSNKAKKNKQEEDISIELESQINPPYHF